MWQSLFLLFLHHSHSSCSQNIYKVRPSRGLRFYRGGSECHQGGQNCPPAVCPDPGCGEMCLGKQELPAVFCLIFFSCTCAAKTCACGLWTSKYFQEWGPSLHLGIPSMLMACTECRALEMGTFFAWLVSVTERGAQAVTYQLPCAAGSVPGAGNTEGTWHFCITVILCLLACTAYLPRTLKDWQTVDLPVTKIAPASRVEPIFPLFHLLHALAGTCGGVLRGTGKPKIGAALTAIAYYVLGFGIGVSPKFAAELGLIGLWIDDSCLPPTHFLFGVQLEGKQEWGSRAGTGLSLDKRGSGDAWSGFTCCHQTAEQGCPTDGNGRKQPVCSSHHCRCFDSEPVDFLSCGGFSCCYCCSFSRSFNKIFKCLQLK